MQESWGTEPAEQLGCGLNGPRAVTGLPACLQASVPQTAAAALSSRCWHTVTQGWDTATGRLCARRATGGRWWGCT